MDGTGAGVSDTESTAHPVNVALPTTAAPAPPDDAAAAACDTGGAHGAAAPESVVVGVKRSGVAAGVRPGEGGGGGGGGGGAEGAVVLPAAKKRKRAWTAEQEEWAGYRSCIGDCARRVDLSGALALVDEMLAKGLRPSLHMFNAVLSIAARVPVPITPVLLNKTLAVFELAAAAAAQEGSNAPPGSPAADAAAAAAEAAFTSVIRACLVTGDRDRAVALFHRMLATGIPPRLRSYTPLLQALSGAGCDHDTTAATFADMLSRHIVPSQMDYACMLLAHGKAGRHLEFTSLLALMMDAVDMVEEPVQTVVRAYFTGRLACGVCGPPVSLASDAHSAPAATADAVAGGAGAVVEGATMPACASLQRPRPLAPCEHGVAGWPWRMSVAHISPRTGVCPVTGARLRSLLLPTDDYSVLLSQVAGLANHVPEPFAHFQAWLREHGPFTAVVDGANVGFFHQNFEGGGLMYSQIDAVVRELQRQGKRVLLVIAKRWLDPARMNSSAARRPRNFKKRRAAYRAALAGGGAQVNAPLPAPGDDLVQAVGAASSGVAAAGVGTSATTGGSGGESMEEEGEGWGGGGDGEGDAIPIAQVRASTYGVPGVAGAGSGCTDGAGGEEEEDDGGGSSWEAGLDEDDSSSGGGGGSTLDAREGVDDGGMEGEGEGGGYVVASNLEEDTKMAGAIVARWLSEGIVYHTHAGTNDDWYWLYAALSRQDQSDITVVSNDFMRDHHFHMLAPKAFLKWRERHQAGFHFRYQPGTRRVVPVIRYPRVYSHRMQVNEAGDTWHFPLVGTVNTWLVATKRPLSPHHAASP